MAYKYCTATNWGKNFFTHEERRNFYLAGHPGDVWVVGNNLFGDQWIGKVSGAIKTKEEAQAIVDAEVTASQTTWDNDNVDGETAEEKIERIGNRPADITLEE